MPSTENTIAIGGPGVLQMYAINKAATPWVPGALIKTLRQTNQTSFAPDGSRIWTVTPENEEDSQAFWTMLKNALPPTTSSGTVAQRTREHGQTVGGGTTGSTDYLILVGGPLGNEDDDDVRKLSLFCVNVDPTSGGTTQQALNPTKPTISFKSSKNSADIEVSAAIINAMPDGLGTAAALYLAVAAETIDAETGHEIVYVPKAA